MNPRNTEIDIVVLDDPHPKHIYITGGLVGVKKETIAARFAAKEEQLQQEGHLVCNHVRFLSELVAECIVNEDPYPQTWEDDMRVRLGILVRCNEMHLLPDWQEDKGCILERDVALRIGIPIVYP